MLELVGLVLEFLKNQSFQDALILPGCLNEGVWHLEVNVCKTLFITAPPKLLFLLSVSLSMASLSSPLHDCNPLLLPYFLSFVVTIAWKYLCFAFALYKKIYYGKSKLIQKERV